MQGCCPRRPPSLDPDDAHDLARNAEATRRLSALAERLDASDLERSLGRGWTVGFALAHVAFWEARQDAALRVWLDGADFPAEDETTNPALEAIAPLLDPAAAVASAEATARQLDATITSLTAGQRAELVAKGSGYAIRRWAHREDHIAQIEAALN